MATKRNRSPDPRSNADRPGCTLCLRLDETTTEELDWVAGDPANRNATVRLAIKEKFKRFSRKK